MESRRLNRAGRNDAAAANRSPSARRNPLVVLAGQIPTMQPTMPCAAEARRLRRQGLSNERAVERMLAFVQSFPVSGG